MSQFSYVLFSYLVLQTFGASFAKLDGNNLLIEDCRPVMFMSARPHPGVTEGSKVRKVACFPDGPTES